LPATKTISDGLSEPHIWFEVLEEMFIWELAVGFHVACPVECRNRSKCRLSVNSMI
jgi:hypothetical protein